jgi:F-box domain
MPTFTGNTDQYGKDVVPPLPVSFDRSMEGRSPSTAAPLFKLPYEILSMILQFVDHPSLSSLALVNSDCRQMARSAQFHSVCFNYSPQSWQLLQLLSNESKERSSNNGRTSSPAIGACIRRITVATQPLYIGQIHQIELSEEFTNLDEDIQDERMGKATEAYELYLELLSDVLSMSQALPHIELLDWEDRWSPPRLFFDHLPQSKIQHLKLYAFQCFLHPLRFYFILV